MMIMTMMMDSDDSDDYLCIGQYKRATMMIMVLIIGLQAKEGKVRCCGAMGGSRSGSRCSG